MPAVPLDGPTLLSIVELVLGFLFGALYIRERRNGKPAPPKLQWRLEILRKVLSSRQFWFACLAAGLLGTCWIGVTLDATGYCRKTDYWNWDCRYEWSPHSTNNSSSDF